MVFEDLNILKKYSIVRSIGKRKINVKRVAGIFKLWQIENKMAGSQRLLLPIICVKRI